MSIPKIMDPPAKNCNKDRVSFKKINDKTHEKMGNNNINDIRETSDIRWKGFIYKYPTQIVGIHVTKIIHKNLIIERLAILCIVSPMPSNKKHKKSIGNIE